MNATDLEAFIDTLIDDLTPGPPPEHDGDRRLFHLLDAPRRVLDDHALLAVLTAAVTTANLANHVLAAAVAAAERAGIPTRRHLRSGTDLLTDLAITPGAAVRAVRVGRAAPTLPALTRAQRLGGVSIEYADAIGKALTHITTRVPLSEQDQAAVVTTLMIQTTPADIASTARAIAIAKTANQPPEEENGVPIPVPVPVPVAENTDLNDMPLIHNDEGRISATLDLDTLTGEELFAALDPLCRPIPEPDGTPDPRPAGKRRADAFGQLIRTYLSSSRRPMSGGVLPHVTLIRPATGAAPAAVPTDTRGDGIPGDGIRGDGIRGDGIRGDGMRGDGMRGDGIPGDGIHGEQGVDTLGFTGPISTATADLISCDSTLGMVLIDTTGTPLDVGRTQRLFPPTVRKGLAVRDRGCAHPGCGRPVSWCDAHHIHEWSHGGITSLDNGVLLCRHHHTMIHHGGWQVYLGADRHPWFIPPHDPTGPEPAHLRSHARRAMTNLPTAA